MLRPAFYRYPGVMNDICALGLLVLCVARGAVRHSARRCAGKEYSKADSRYASRDAFVVSMEAVTAFVEGPLCWVIVGGLLARRAWTPALMLAVSLGQLYGDVLYFATALLGGAHASLCSSRRLCCPTDVSPVTTRQALKHLTWRAPCAGRLAGLHGSREVDDGVRQCAVPTGNAFCRPEAQYWGGYFWGLNNVWTIVPGLCCWHACSTLNAAVAQSMARLS